jgi:hypothetical protein
MSVTKYMSTTEDMVAMSATTDIPPSPGLLEKPFIANMRG